MAWWTFVFLIKFDWADFLLIFETIHKLFVPKPSFHMPAIPIWALGRSLYFSCDLGSRPHPHAKFHGSECKNKEKNPLGL